MLPCKLKCICMQLIVSIDLVVIACSVLTRIKKAIFVIYRILQTRVQYMSLQYTRQNNPRLGLVVSYIISIATLNVTHM